MGVIDYIKIAYYVVAVLVAGYTYSRLRDPLYYRVLFSCILGVFWPIPVAIGIIIWIEGLIIDFADWVSKHF